MTVGTTVVHWVVVVHAIVACVVVGLHLNSVSSWALDGVQVVSFAFRPLYTLVDNPSTHCLVGPAWPPDLAWSPWVGKERKSLAIAGTRTHNSSIVELM